MIIRFMISAGLSAAPLAASAQQAIPVTTEPARIGSQPVEVLAKGTVVSGSVVTIRTRVDGKIQQVHVTEGQLVRRGQPLFTIDSRLNSAILIKQEAQLAANRAQIVRFQADAVRYQSLRGEGFAAQQRLEQVTAESAAAVANARATEALIQQTRLNIEFATIVAETDGKLGTLPLRVGNVVRQAENVSMASITQMNPILVQSNVPERWLPQIRFPRPTDMHISELCIRRPVMTLLLTAAALVAGTIAYTRLPVAAVPRVDFPVISVFASFPGASPETMATSVALPLEREFSTIAGLENRAPPRGRTR